MIPHLAQWVKDLAIAIKKKKKKDVSVTEKKREMLSLNSSEAGGTDEFCLFFLFRATPAAYGSSQARGQIEAVAAGLCHGHSNSGSKLHLQPIPQLTATLDP